MAIAQSDNGNSETQVQLRVILEALAGGEAPLTLRAPQADTVLQLVSTGPEVTTQVQVLVDAMNTDAEITLTLSADDAEVVLVPSTPITIAADGDAVRRSTQFGLVGRKVGETRVSIVVTDGTYGATVALRVVVRGPLQILSPLEGAHFELVRGNGSAAIAQVEVLISQLQTEIPATLDLQLGRGTPSPVIISTTSLILAALDDGSDQRMAEFVLFAVEAGNTTLALVVSDRAGNRDAVIIDVSVTRVNKVCETCLVPDTVIVPPGSFTMGSPSNEPDRQADEGPQHPVSINYAFAAGKYELTRGQYRAFVEASGHSAGGGWISPGFTQIDAHPVVNVSWNDADAYIRWLSKETGEEWRLLSEAEWEYAARAGTTTSYSFGNTINAMQARFDSTTGTVAVGSYPANAFGLHDMHGNVWEWAEDCWHSNYNAAPTDGSAWLSGCVGTTRVLRGGTWRFDSELMRSANRFNSEPENRFNVAGFRVARTLRNAVDLAVQHTLDVVEPQADTVLQLVLGDVVTTTQVQVLVDATDTAAELTLRIFVGDAEVVSVPSTSIAIVADGNAVQRSAQFELLAKRAGETTVSLVVTDGVNVATVALRVVVIPLQIVSPLDGVHINLVRGNGSLATTPVEFVITQTQTDLPVTLDLQLERVIPPPVFISTTSLILAAPDDGSIRRMAEFTLAAAEAGNTTLTLVASDRLGNRSAVSVRVSVTRTKVVCETCLVPDMITVSTGTFTMGSPSGEADRLSNEGPQHQVRIGYAFSVGKYELTRGQYRAFVNASGHNAGTGSGSWLQPGFRQNDAHPVVNVSWGDAKAYLAWLSKETGEEWRLLSEAEWEYAGRAGTTTSYAFGDTIVSQARFGSGDGTVAVGSYAANAFGLYDMHGNVWEWVEDCWHFDYTGAPVDGSAWLSDCILNESMLRGGAFLSVDEDLRSARRNSINPQNRAFSIGFRVARSLSP